MKLVAGLGNPGVKYDGTRHNVGFAAVDLLARRHFVQWEKAPRGAAALVGRWRAADVVLVKPLTFMNLSGEAIAALLNFYKIEVEDLVVVVDEVQLDTGRIRIRGEGTAGGHNGLKSIIASLGTMVFPRIRIGVGRGDGRRDLADHVLSRFEPDERAIIEDSVTRVADAVESFVEEGLAATMNRFNRKQDTGNGKTGNGSEDN